jgi:hypothetical protein
MLTAMFRQMFSAVFVGTRRAIALVVLGFIWTTFAWVALAAPPELRALFLGLSATYVLGFVAVGAGYFWGRWYANGLGWNGAWALLAALQVDDPRPVIVWAGLHIVVLLLLAGRPMIEAYEGRADWRERLGVKEENVGKIGAAVTTVASLLPVLVAQVLGRTSAVELATFAAAALGLFLVLRMRTGGLFLLAGAGALSLAAGGPAYVAIGRALIPMPSLAPIVAAGLAVPLAIFLPAIVRTLRRA